MSHESMVSLSLLWTFSDHNLCKKWDYFSWVKSCKYRDEIECGLIEDGWLWYSQPENTQESGDTPCFLIMLLCGMFWDGVCKVVAVLCNAKYLWYNCQEMKTEYIGHYVLLVPISIMHTVCVITTVNELSIPLLLIMCDQLHRDWLHINVRTSI